LRNRWAGEAINGIRRDRDMGYFNALWNYLKTEKGKRDLEDYVRAAVIIAAAMAMVKIIADMLF
jgi:hypothetical protein